MSSPSRRLIVPYLALVVAGLCYLNWWQATAPIDVSPVLPEKNATPQPDRVKNPGTPPQSERSLAELSETVQRPLFRSDRRPPQPARPETKPAAESAPTATPVSSADTLRFIGLMRSGTSAQRALIRVAGLPTAEWVEVGGEVGGWTVGKIEPDRVLVKRNGDTAELKLFTLKPASSTPALEEPDRKAP